MNETKLIHIFLKGLHCRIVVNIPNSTVTMHNSFNYMNSIMIIHESENHKIVSLINNNTNDGLQLLNSEFINKINTLIEKELLSDNYQEDNGIPF